MKNKGTLFAVTPQYEGDTLYVLARTKKGLKPFDAYMIDEYIEIDRFGSKKEMLDFVKKNCKDKPVYI